MKNLKSFLFKSKGGSFFILSITRDDNRKLYAKTLGANILPNKDFINVYSVNYMTEWLCNNGNTYIKRLPVIAGSEYNERQLKEVLGMFRHLKVS